jgi:peptidoglycan/xylan/chitin deacetylase (PgdA/CDA1 family)
VLTWDFSHEAKPDGCLRNAIDSSGPGSVVVFHDSLKSIDNVRYALPRFLDHFLEQGFRFEAIRL